MFGSIKQILYFTFVAVNKRNMKYTATHHHHHFPNE